MSLSPPTADSLRELCSSLEYDFLDAVIDSDSSTRNFADRFKELHDSSFTELSRSSLPTVAMAYSTASNISTISSSFIELEYKSTELEKELLSEIDSILKDLTLEDFPRAVPKSTKQSGLTSANIVLGPCSNLISKQIRSLAYR